MGCAPLRIKGLLKISLWISSPIPFGCALQNVRIGYGLLRRLEIMRVIRGEAKFAPGLERYRQVTNKIGLNQPARPMPPFRPGIRKHDVRNRNASQRKEIPHGITKLQSEDEEIRQLRPRSPFLNFSHTP